ncbi:4-hydroxy-3-methylbut-2-enyl diphosphate reductase [Bacteroidota bacterium]
MISIDVDERSGFCTGVIKAVKAAEDHLKDQTGLCSLGELVHNSEEVDRLKRKGLDALSYEEFDRLENTTVLIRAHGEPPETFQKGREQNIRFIDATCPIVKSIQKQIRECYAALSGKEGSILIFGKKSHPEVRALLGQTEGNAIVVRQAGELAALKLQSPVFIFSQTTMNLGEYDLFQEALRKRMNELGYDPELNLHVHDTVCKQVSSREKYLEKFVARYDMVFFVSGKKSSNGKALYKVCQEINKNTHFISSPGESDSIQLKGVKSIGICGATSTPGWLLHAVKERLHNRLKLAGR